MRLLCHSLCGSGAGCGWWGPLLDCSQGAGWGWGNLRAQTGQGLLCAQSGGRQTQVPAGGELRAGLSKGHGSQTRPPAICRVGGKEERGCPRGKPESLWNLRQTALSPVPVCALGARVSGSGPTEWRELHNGVNTEGRNPCWRPEGCLPQIS